MRLRKPSPLFYIAHIQQDKSLTSISSNDYSKLLAGRVHEEKTKRDEIRKRRASSLKK